MDLQVSEKHGANPLFLQCFFCLRDMGVMLMGKIEGLKDPDPKAPPRVSSSANNPCDSCKKLMKDGVIVITVAEGAGADPFNPQRTGGWLAVSESFIRKVLSGEDLESVLQWRVALISDDVWVSWGLPTEDENEQC